MKKKRRLYFITTLIAASVFTFFLGMIVIPGRIEAEDAIERGDIERRQDDR